VSAPATPALEAPAKVNLGLRVTGVRPDGYHELDSLFVPLDLCDAVHLEVREGEPAGADVSVEVAPGVPGAVPAGPGNLAARAAAAFLERAGLRARVSVRLVKRIPSPGGLGGGSSDAAAVLRGLAARFPAALSWDDLRALGLALGADVPFFLGPDGAGPTPSRVTGVGERVESLPAIPALDLALVHPGPALETARVYAEFDARDALTGPGGAPTMPALQGLPAEEDPSDPDRWRSAEWLSRLCVNDLEPAARRLCPAIAALREALSASGALAVGLSGSGPTVFGIFRDAPAASKALAGASLRGLLGSPGSAPTGSQGWAGVARTRASREPG
jgi:4-diphosphocytidyl-2-C-methyl-D-erythritol kinase